MGMKVYRSPSGQKKPGIYKRDDSPYLWIGFTHRKKRYGENSKSDKFKEAEKLLNRRKGEIEKGKFSPRNIENISLKEIAEDFLSNYRANERRSLDRAEKSVEHLLRHLNGFFAVEVTTDEVTRYVEKRKREMTRSGNPLLRRQSTVSFQHSRPFSISPPRLHRPR